MTTIQPIRDAMDAYLACDDGVSGYVLLVALRDAVRVAVSEIATRSGCQVSEEVAGTSSYYITISREDADGETYATPARQLGRVSDEEWAELQAAASEAGKSFTAWAVGILLRAAKRVEPPL